MLRVTILFSNSSVKIFQTKGSINATFLAMGSTNVAQRCQAFIAPAHQAFAFQTPAIGATLLEVVAKWIEAIIDGPADPKGRVADVAIGGAAAVRRVPVVEVVPTTASGQAARAGPGAGRADGLVARPASDIAFDAEGTPTVDTAALTGSTHRLTAVITSLHAVGA